MIGFLSRYLKLFNYRISKNVHNHELILSKIFPARVPNSTIALNIYEKYEELVSTKTDIELELSLNSGKQIVLIYQMGKIGSTSYKKLLSQYSEFHVIHLHRLSLKSNDKRIQEEIKNFSPHRALQERRWKQISLFIKNNRPPVYIISGMRDPVARNISAYFENIGLKGFSDFHISSLIDDFFQTYSHHIPLNWFDEQFNQALNINIMKFPFNKETGVGNIEKDNFRCLLLNIEASEANKVRAISQFLRLNITRIKRENIGKTKNYSDLYAQFKDQVKIPKSYLEQMYNSQVVRHFYTLNQIQKFYQTWDKPEILS